MRKTKSCFGIPSTTALLLVTAAAFWFAESSAFGQSCDSPVALFTLSPEQPLLNQQFNVDASLSFDRPQAGPISAYQWNWGDGSANSSGVSAQHTYTAAGQFTITLTVTAGVCKTGSPRACATDAECPANNRPCVACATDLSSPPRTGSTTETVVIASPVTPPPPPTVGNRAPVASLEVNPLVGFTEDVFTFNAQGTTDPDVGDTLSYRFVFGDGEQTAFTASATATHRYAAAGTYTVRLTARDQLNASTDLTRSMHVLEQGEQNPPIALIAIGPRTGAAPLTLTFDGRLSYDPDGDPITYLWTFSLDGEVVDTLTDSLATRVFEEIGTYTVVLEVADANGAIGVSDPETVLVTERGTPIEPPPPLPVPTPEPPPPSYEQRPPQMCGAGMLMGFFGSLLGLSTMRGVRRKRTPA